MEHRSNLKIVFDMDNVLNNLLEHTFDLAGIDRFKIKHINNYDIFKNSILTSDEKDKIIKLWHTPETFLGCMPQEGIEEIIKLKDLCGIDLIIHSRCESTEIMQVKMDWLRRYIKDMQDIEVKFEVKQKTPCSDVYAIVEDNLEYLLQCKANYKVIIDMPYNKEENYEIAKNANEIVRVKSLKEAICFIRRTLNNGGAAVKDIQ